MVLLMKTTLNADLIRTRREALGWSQYVLARHMSVAPKTIWMWENDPPRTLDYATAVRLAVLLEIEPGSLFANGDGNE